MNKNTPQEILQKLVEHGVLVGKDYKPGALRGTPKEILQSAIEIIQERQIAFRYSKFAEVAYWLVGDLYDYPKTCPTCNKKITAFHSFPLGYKRDFCCNSCSQKSPVTRATIEGTMLRTRGVRHQMHDESVKTRIAETNLERYGAENVFASDELRSRLPDIYLEKLGVSNPSQSESVKQKKRETTFSNFGVEYPGQSPEVRSRTHNTHRVRYGRFFNNREKAASTLMESHGVHNVALIPEVVARRTERLRITIMGESTVALLNDKAALSDAIQNTDVVSLAEKLGIGFSTIYVQCKRLGIELPARPTSRDETQLREWLSEIGVSFRTNDRKLIRPQELDITIDSHKIAIELNGVYWHSETSGKSENYHLAKTEAVERLGWKLIHIFDDEWRDKAAIVRSRLLSALGRNDTVMARQCQIIELDASTANQFLEDNHIQGKDQASVRYGLAYEGNLVAVMTFVRPRFNRRFAYEMSRYASKLGVNVVGGGSRLFTKFVREHNPTSVITYADRRFGGGGFYHKLGFVEQEPTRPSYFYIVNGKRQSRLAWQKHKLAAKLEHFDPDLTESDNMLLHGITRVFDCGHRVFSWTRP